MSGPPKDYIEVKDRLVLLFEKYPEASVQGSYELAEVNNQTTYIYEARVYRTPEDPRPGVGHASESLPGTTNFTRGSELEVAGTSAVGRALVMIGIAAHKGVASAQDVRIARAKNSSSAPVGSPNRGNGGRGDHGSTGAPLSNEQALNLQLELDTRAIDDKQLIRVICDIMQVEAPILGEGQIEEWADKALRRFPSAKYDALLERVKRYPAEEV